MSLVTSFDLGVVAVWTRLASNNFSLGTNCYARVTCSQVSSKKSGLFELGVRRAPDFQWTGQRSPPQAARAFYVCPNMTSESSWSFVGERD